jgi:hypothetical protein
MVRKKIIQKLRILCLKRSMNGHEEERVKYEKDERKKQALSRLDEIAAQTRKLQKLDFLLDQ